MIPDKSCPRMGGQTESVFSEIVFLLKVYFPKPKWKLSPVILEVGGLQETTKCCFRPFGKEIICKFCYKKCISLWLHENGQFLCCLRSIIHWSIYDCVRCLIIGFYWKLFQSIMKASGWQMLRERRSGAPRKVRVFYERKDPQQTLFCGKT